MICTLKGRTACAAVRVHAVHAVCVLYYISYLAYASMALCTVYILFGPIHSNFVCILF